MKHSLTKWLFFALVTALLTIGIGSGMTSEAKADGIGGKTQWNFGDTIVFSNSSLSYNTFYNYVRVRPTSTLQIDNGTYTVTYESWNDSDKYFNIIFKHNNGVSYLQIRPEDYQEASPQTPIGIRLVSGAGTNESPYLFELVYKPVLQTKSETVKESTVYMGEILVDGTSQLRYLYSSDISVTAVVFDNLKNALKDTAFQSMVPTIASDAVTVNGFFRYSGNAQKGTAYSSETNFFSGISEDWSSVTSVAGRCFTGKVDTETKGNLPAASGPADEEITGTLFDNGLFYSTLAVSMTSNWEKINGVMVKVHVATLKNEGTTIKYTIVNVSTPYTVTVTSDGHGTASASPASGIKGTEVSLTATPNSGYRFKEWQVISGGVKVADNKFTIGTANVEIKAVFEELPTEPGTQEESQEGSQEESQEGTQEGSQEESPASINLGIKKLKIKDGAPKTITAKLGNPNDTITGAKVSKKNIVKVKTSGNKIIITPKKTGKTKITVTTAKGAETQFEVQVKKGSSLNVGKQLTLKPGESFTIEAYAVPSSVKLKSVTSSKPKVVKVGKKGQIKAKKSGKAKITVELSNGKKYTIKVTVK